MACHTLSRSGFSKAIITAIRARISPKRFLLSFRLCLFSSFFFEFWYGAKIAQISELTKYICHFNKMPPMLTHQGLQAIFNFLNMKYN